MDVVKIFVEDPAALAAPADGSARPAPASLAALLAGVSSGVGRAYLAGTVVGPDGAAQRTGLTALAHADAVAGPLAAWVAGRPLTTRAAEGRLQPVGNLAAVLAAAAGPVGVGPATADDLARLAAGDRGDALRALVARGGAALVPEPAPDGADWSVYGPSPLGLVEAFRATPAPADVVRVAAPLRAARSEAKFYVERWALDALPPWAERL